MRCVTYRTVLCLLAHQAKARLLFGPLDNEAHAHGLDTTGAVKRIDLDVTVRLGLAAGIDFIQHGCTILDGEHGNAPHIPIGVPRMGVIGPLN